MQEAGGGQADAARINQKQELINTRSKTSCPCFQVACAGNGRSDVALHFEQQQNWQTRIQSEAEPDKRLTDTRFTCCKVEGAGGGRSDVAARRPGIRDMSKIIKRKK